MAGPLALRDCWCRDTRGVGHTLALNIWRVRSRLRRTARNVARPYNHRERPFVRAFVILQGLYIADGDLDRLARQNVGDRLREDVGALLIQKARGLPARPRSRVGGLRLFAPHELAFYNALAYEHRHIVNGSRLRQRKRVDGLYLVLKWIFKFLCDRDARDKPAHFGADSRVLERARARKFSARIPREE